MKNQWRSHRMLNDQSILITGGTGSFGQAFVKYVLDNFKPKRLVIFSRDELKQFEMAHEFSGEKYPCLRYFLGDVRDVDRLKQAMSGIDIVIHAAAMKQIPASEYNPFECIKTNILGAENVINSAIYCEVKKVVALSTDKAVNPINLYGATKLASDKVFISANNMSGTANTRFSVVRYGNVLGSRGSVIPYFKKLISQGQKELPVTHAKMTRFWIVMEQAIGLVITTLEQMEGGEIFVPKIPSMKMIDMAKAMGSECTVKIVGIRPGEKLHELMIPADEARNTLEFENHYVIQPAFHWWDRDEFQNVKGGRPALENFEYSSDNNSDWLSVDDLQKIIAGKFGSVQQPVA
jgi:UDP-N-acetylglucosamine 4,6-dehydratase